MKEESDLEVPPAKSEKKKNKYGMKKERGNPNKQESNMRKGCTEKVLFCP